MEKASFNILRQRQIHNKDLHGLVRIAITEGLGTYWLLPRLLDFQKANRLLTIEMQCTMLPTDVGRLEADISIQFTRPERLDLITVRLGFLHIYPFSSAGYARLYGLPSSKEDIGRHRIIQQVSPLLDESAYARNLGVEKIEGIVGVRTNASSALLYAVERDAGSWVSANLRTCLGGRKFGSCRYGRTISARDMDDLSRRFAPISAPHGRRRMAAPDFRCAALSVLFK